jgi:hypothetical protein
MREELRIEKTHPSTTPPTGGFVEQAIFGLEKLGLIFPSREWTYLLPTYSL